MQVKIKQIEPLPIYHFAFKRQYDMNMTFVRIQEHYESPKFKGKVFDLEEYMDWYYDNEAKEGFDYLTRVEGMNFPSVAVASFLKKFPTPLRRREEWFFEETLELGLDGEYYIIATFGESEALGHEIRHGLYYLCDEYRR